MMEVQSVVGTQTDLSAIMLHEAGPVIAALIIVVPAFCTFAYYCLAYKAEIKKEQERIFDQVRKQLINFWKPLRQKMLLLRNCLGLFWNLPITKLKQPTRIKKVKLSLSYPLQGKVYKSLRILKSKF